MADKLMVELQDSNGNIFYAQTSAAAVFCADGKTVQEKIGTVKGRIATKDNLKLVTEANYLAEAKAVKDLFDELNSKLSYTTWSSGKKIPFSSINGNNSLYVKLAKFGKVVYCRIICTMQISTANASFSLSEITIPSEYRPAENVYASYAGNTGANMSGTGRWEVCSDGALKMIGSTVTFSERHASISWIIN